MDLATPDHKGYAKVFYKIKRYLVPSSPHWFDPWCLVQ